MLGAHFSLESTLVGRSVGLSVGLSVGRSVGETNVWRSSNISTYVPTFRGVSINIPTSTLREDQNHRRTKPYARARARQPTRPPAHLRVCDRPTNQPADCRSARLTDRPTDQPTSSSHPFLPPTPRCLEQVPTKILISLRRWADGAAGSWPSGGAGGAAGSMRWRAMWAVRRVSGARARVC